MEALNGNFGHTLGDWFNMPGRRQAEFLSQYGGLASNQELFNAFIREAHTVRDKGFDHYSARTIAEYIRHHTAVSGSDYAFKVNNNIIPVMARASMAMFPYLNGLFELRGQQ